jgi:hypothetical protein
MGGNVDIQTLIFAAAVAGAFGGVWWGLSRLGANAFVVPFLSALAALLVFLSHSLLGVRV